MKTDVFKKYKHNNLRENVAMIYAEACTLHIMHCLKKNVDSCLVNLPTMIFSLSVIGKIFVCL